MSTDPRCGTYAGYQAHHARLERPCASCRAANARYQSLTRVMNGTTKARRVSIAVLRDLAQSTRDPVTKDRLERIIYDAPLSTRREVPFP